MSAEAALTDRIEKSIVLRAPRARVWRAMRVRNIDAHVAGAK